MSTMQQGVVIKKLADKWFGFIKVDGRDKDLFFHGNELQNVSFEELREGDRVSFELGEGPKGPNATNVSKI